MPAGTDEFYAARPTLLRAKSGKPSVPVPSVNGTLQSHRRGRQGHPYDRAPQRGERAQTRRLRQVRSLPPSSAQFRKATITQVTALIDQNGSYYTHVNVALSIESRLVITVISTVRACTGMIGTHETGLCRWRPSKTLVTLNKQHAVSWLAWAYRQNVGRNEGDER
jgi:hypothetical protein